MRRRRLEALDVRGESLQAGDEARSRDLRLGKPTQRVAQNAYTKPFSRPDQADPSTPVVVADPGTADEGSNARVSAAAAAAKVVGDSGG